MNDTILYTSMSNILKKLENIEKAVNTIEIEVSLINAHQKENDRKMQERANELISSIKDSDALELLGKRKR